MSDIFDYLTWRGDISFRDSPFNEIDNIILCQLSYITYSGIVPEVFTDSVTLKEAAQADYSAYTNINPLLYTLLQKSAATKRFENVRLTGYSDILIEKEDCQFSAITFLFDSGCAFVAYRGTDCSVTGLKEDFNMVYKAPISGQAKGVHYLEKLYRDLSWWKRRKQLMLGGHSKGGNIAQYAAMFCSKRIQKHITLIWSNDGPGFNEDFFPENMALPFVDRMKSFMPVHSIIGRLFDHQEELCLISSRDKGIGSHDPFSWEVSGTQFVHETSASPKTEKFDRSFRDWLTHIDLAERKNLVEAIFDVLKDMGIESLFDFKDFKLSQAITGIKTLTQLDSEQKKALVHGLTQFTKSYNL